MPTVVATMGADPRTAGCPPHRVPRWPMDRQNYSRGGIADGFAVDQSSFGQSIGIGIVVSRVGTHEEDFPKGCLGVLLHNKMIGVFH